MLRSLGASSPPMARFVEHHLSHAASAFFPSPFSHAGVLTVDGLGEWATATIGLGSVGAIDLIEELRFLLARVAWDDGYELAVSNHAIPGDVAWIENRRLERVFARGAEHLDAVVFWLSALTCGGG